MIDILMAVYNGEKYLSQQIDSILAQSSRDWHLHICDDGSADRSYEIVLDYAQRYPEQITAQKNETPSGSACANFMGMLKRSQAEYVMFSDQDDFWLPDKVRLTFEKMKQMEQVYGDSPLLVHTEMEIVDSELNRISPSFTRFQRLNPQCNTLNRLLCQNNVTGCTVMINRSLADLVKDAPAGDMLMHDWWIALAAAAFGRIGFVDQPLNRYRQHGGNQLGAVNNGSLTGAARIVKERLRTKKRVSVTFRQAKLFAEYYEDRLFKEAKRILDIYTEIPFCKKAKRIYKLVRYGFLKQNFMAAVGQLIFC